MKKKKKFTKEYAQAPYEEKIIWSWEVPESVKKQHIPRRFATWEDVQKGIAIKPYK